MTAPFSAPGIEHIEACYQPLWEPCPVSADGFHRWSGWPGAYCQDCDISDYDELCMGCLCPCHEEWYKEYAALGGRE